MPLISFILPSESVSRVSQSSRKSRTLGIDENFRKEIIDWILQVGQYRISFPYNINVVD